MSSESSIAASLRAWLAGQPENIENLDAVLAGELPCFVLGRNCNSEFMARFLPIAGFIDDFADKELTWHGLPIIRCADLPHNAAVINAVLHRRPHLALKRLGQLPQAPIIMHYADFVRYLPDKFPPLPVEVEARTAFHAHRDEFDALARRLADAESVQTLHDVILYRMTGDPAFTQSYSIRENDQYFDVPLNLSSDTVFVDGGAYCGETTEIFCQNYPEYSRVHLFEPNAVSLEKARVKLAGYQNIEYYNSALGDERTQLRFDASAANASRISGDGEESVNVLPIDDLPGAVGFIKMDLEGYEPKALIGARRTISTHHPALAICVYHYATDFIDVPRIVLDVRDDYCINLRHYTEGWEETVMYFSRPSAT